MALNPALSATNTSLPKVVPEVRARLGLLGGTFDPIHLGHLIIAEEAWTRLGLAQVLLIPAKSPPHKARGAWASAEERVRMTQLAIADNPHLALSWVDLQRPGPSFTVDTLNSLRTQYGPAAEFHFILGADSLVNLKTWYHPQEILRLTRIAAFTRPGYPVDLAALEQDLPGLTQATTFFDTVEIGISSTDLRARVRQGLPIRYQVPAAVEAYIVEHGLYR